MSLPSLVSDSPLSRTVDATSDSRVYSGLTAAVSLLCMFWLAFIFGTIATRLSLRGLMTLSWIRVIVISLYVFAICFIFTSAILTGGLSLQSHRDCYSAAMACLVFYFGSKVILYMFLVERAHVINAPYQSRLKDKIWVVGMAFIILGFGSISVAAIIFAISEISPIDGKCRIGQPLKITIPLLTYDIAINVGLTGLFVHFLHPFLAPRGNRTTLSTLWQSGSRRTLRLNDNAKPTDRVTGRLRKLVLKTIIGAGLVMLPTIANLTTVLITRGREQGWLCLSLCSLDVTWTVTVVHWLTMNNQDVEESVRSFHRPNPTLPSYVAGDNVDLVKRTIKAFDTQVTDTTVAESIMGPPQASTMESIIEPTDKD